MESTTPNIPEDLQPSASWFSSEVLEAINREVLDVEDEGWRVKEERRLKAEEEAEQARISAACQQISALYGLLADQQEVLNEAEKTRDRIKNATDNRYAEHGEGFLERLYVTITGIDAWFLKVHAAVLELVGQAGVMDVIHEEGNRENARVKYHELSARKAKMMPREKLADLCQRIKVSVDNKESLDDMMEDGEYKTLDRLLQQAKGSLHILLHERIRPSKECLAKLKEIADPDNWKGLDEVKRQLGILLKDTPWNAFFGDMKAIRTVKNSTALVDYDSFFKRAQKRDNEVREVEAERAKIVDDVVSLMQEANTFDREFDAVYAKTGYADSDEISRGSSYIEDIRVTFLNTISNGCLFDAEEQDERHDFWRDAEQKLRSQNPQPELP